jgi:hypothetical protein
MTTLTPSSEDEVGDLLRGVRLRRALAELPGWRPARAQQALRATCTPSDRLSALWLLTALLSHPGGELVHELVIRHGRIRIEVAEPHEGGVSARCVRLAGEVSGVLTRLGLGRRPDPPSLRRRPGRELPG